MAAVVRKKIGLTPRDADMLAQIAIECGESEDAVVGRALRLLAEARTINRSNDANSETAVRSPAHSAGSGK